jgi:hypothetical protein
MTSGNGTPRPYSVSMSQVQRAKLLKLWEQADAQGDGPRFVAAYREIVRRLQRDPRVFGEALYKLSALNLEVRQAVVAPIVVDFAVHEKQEAVFVRGFKVLS